MFPLPNNEFGFIEVGKVGCVGLLEVRDRTTISQGEKLQKVLTRTPETGLRICGLPCAHPGEADLPPPASCGRWGCGAITALQWVGRAEQPVLQQGLPLLSRSVADCSSCLCTGHSRTVS